MPSGRTSARGRPCGTAARQAGRRRDRARNARRSGPGGASSRRPRRRRRARPRRACRAGPAQLAVEQVDGVVGERPAHRHPVPDLLHRLHGDQMVASVGPYMLRISPPRAPRSVWPQGRGQGLAAEEQSRAEAREQQSVSGSAASIPASEGVHWRWVTPWRAIWAGRSRSRCPRPPMPRPRALAQVGQPAQALQGDRRRRRRSRSGSRSRRRPIAQPVDRPQAGLGRAEEAGGLEVAVEGVSEEGLQVLLGQLARPRPGRGARARSSHEARTSSAGTR